MKQVNEKKVQSGMMIRLGRWVAGFVERHVDRLVAMRAFDDRRYDYTRSGKQ